MKQSNWLANVYNSKNGPEQVYMVSYFVILFMLSFLFRYFPELDVGFSRLFFNPDTKQFCQWSLLLWFDRAIFWCGIFFAGLISWWLINILRQDYQQRRGVISAMLVGIMRDLPRYFAPLYLSSALLIIPVLISHYAFKGVFHRPRPFEIIEFGGAYEFTRAWDLAGACLEKCSFPSSHAAVGYFLYTLLWVARPNGQIGDGLTGRIIYHVLVRCRPQIFLIATSLGFGFGLIRVAIGRHFLSDVIFSGFIAFAAAYLWHLILGWYVDQTKEFFARFDRQFAE